MGKLNYNIKRNSLLILMILVSSSMKAPYYYLNWILGVFIITREGIKVFNKNSIKINNIRLFLLSTVWLIGPFLSTIFKRTVDVNESFKYMILYVFHTIVGILILNFLRELNKDTRNKVFLFINKTWLMISSFALVFTYFSFYNNGLADFNFSGIVENRNVFSITTTLFISYLMFYKDEFNKSDKVSLLILISFVLIISTYSVKGFVGWITIYGFSNFKNIKKPTRKFWFNFALTFILLISIFGYLILTEHQTIIRINRFLMYFTNPGALSKSESAFLRGYYINEGISVIKQHPLVGIGINNSKYFIISPKSIELGHTIGTYSHNGYVEMLLNGGIISFLLYYGLFIFTFLKLNKNRKQDFVANYLFMLTVYRLIIDFGSVSTEHLLLNFVYSLIIFYLIDDNMFYNF